jgi:hypothetical protein
MCGGLLAEVDGVPKSAADFRLREMGFGRMRVVV